MHLTSKRNASGILPLQNAVLCVDCETISDSQFDLCPVCGGHSLLSIARMLGGTLLKKDAVQSVTTSFDSEITIYLSQIGAGDFSAVLEGITRAIKASSARGRASLHVDVEPIEAIAVPHVSRAA